MPSLYSTSNGNIWKLFYTNTEIIICALTKSILIQKYIFGSLMIAVMHFKFGFSDFIERKCVLATETKRRIYHARDGKCRRYILQVPRNVLISLM